MSRYYRKVSRILDRFAAGDSVKRQCRRCKFMFEIFELEFAIPDYLCLHCWMTLDSEITVGVVEKTALNKLSQSVETQPREKTGG